MPLPWWARSSTCTSVHPHPTNRTCCCCCCLRLGVRIKGDEAEAVGQASQAVMARPGNAAHPMALHACSCSCSQVDCDGRAHTISRPSMARISHTATAPVVACLWKGGGGALRSAMTRRRRARFLCQSTSPAVGTTWHITLDACCAYRAQCMNCVRAPTTSTSSVGCAHVGEGGCWADAMHHMQCALWPLAAIAIAVLPLLCLPQLSPSCALSPT